ncbi:ATP-binding protein [Paraburkholderia sp. GAS334]|uniref:ATP-binding protein n=1 Tax=unclassified Paraburkholderia TaxID=2615204 RepID=UPI003D24BB1F
MVTRYSLTFGPFRIDFPQRVLTRNGDEVRIGSRALDILIVLAEHGGELVSTRQLRDEVWKESVVDDGALRVHVSTLRKALSDGQSESRYIVNDNGRGYRLAVPVHSTRATQVTAPAPTAPTSTPDESARALPVTLARVVGREDVIDGLTDQLPERRLLTIAGPGGIGKTTVAVAIAYRFSGRTGIRALFVNFAPVSDKASVASTVASTLGVAVFSGNPVPGLIASLGDTPILLVLDNCEHVVEAVAQVAEQLLQGTSGVHLLVTSREPLRADGESVHRLSALPFPDVGARIGIEAAGSFPAISLFHDRAKAADDAFQFTVSNIGAVADICRRLDGIPLAIEFAAARVAHMDVRAIAARLDDRFALLTQGRRTALPRHQTLKATLDWSYELLDPREQHVLRRLSVMRSSFGMREAVAVAGCGQIDELAVFDAISGLVAKSLVARDIGDADNPYRLLDTTRQYAHLRLLEAGEANATRRLHTIHCCETFADLGAAWEGKAQPQWLAQLSKRIDDIRAAFEWASHQEGDPELEIDLVIATAPLWLHLSLPHEFLSMAEHAIAAVERSERSEQAGSTRHAELLVAYGHSLWHTRGPTIEMARAFERAYALSRRLGDEALEFRILWGVFAHRLVTGRYLEGLALAEAMQAFADRSADSTLNQMSGRNLAYAHHYLGDQAKARTLIERVIALEAGPTRENLSKANDAQMDGRIASMTVYMRILWLQGETERAVRLARDCAELVASIEHDLSLVYGLALGSIPIMIWAGEHDFARQLTRMLRECTSRRGLAHWDVYGEGFEHILAGKPVTLSRATVPQLEAFASAGCKVSMNALILADRVAEPCWVSETLHEYARSGVQWPAACTGGARGGET